MAHNDLKVRQAIMKSGVGQLKQDETPISKEKRTFIAIFKQKYLQFIDLKYEKQFSPVTNKVLTTTIERLLGQGSNSQQFLEWLWGDFFTLQKNKKYLPCDIVFSCSGWIVDKFLYEHKDKLRMRKQNLVDSGVKNQVMTLAMDFYQKYQTDQDFDKKSFGEKMLLFNRGQMTITKFIGIFKKFCEKAKDKYYLEKLNEIYPS